MKVDILFLAHNRREYTEEALRQLERNTNWDLVDQFVFYNDDSDIEQMNGLSIRPVGVPVFIQDCPESLGPIGIMNDYIKKSRITPWFAKIDNDTIVPPGWLDACVEIAATDNTDLIGIETRYCQYPPMKPDWYPVIKYRTTDHVGGIGLFRRAMFEQCPLTVLTAQEQAAYRANGRDPRYYGFTEWQWAHPDVRKCWIDPPLPVFLLDHLPFAPWKSLGEEYVSKGWQRESWGYYHPVKDRGLWEWWLNAC
jgi:hypothetical protein